MSNRRNLIRAMLAVTAAGSISRAGAADAAEAEQMEDWTLDFPIAQSKCGVPLFSLKEIDGRFLNSATYSPDGKFIATTAVPNVAFGTHIPERFSKF